jgi:assimilatory nitrate reductase catalytic subunit
VAVGHRQVTERQDRRYPYLLTTGRSRTHYQSGAQTRRTRALADAEPVAYAELHPLLAARAGIVDGAAVRLTTRRGSTVVTVRVTDTVRPDTVFVPFHWPRVNDLTSARLDPTSRMPEFKACAVAVTPVGVGPAAIPSAAAPDAMVPNGADPSRTHPDGAIPDGARPVPVPHHEEDA